MIGMLLCAVLSFIFVNRAYAYIDPGTGSMIVQAIIAAIAAVSVSIGVFRRQVASFFSRLFRRGKNVGDASDD
jgi:hypothetical protein